METDKNTQIKAEKWENSLLRGSGKQAFLALGIFIAQIACMCHGDEEGQGTFSKKQGLRFQPHQLVAASHGMVFGPLVLIYQTQLTPRLSNGGEN